MDLKYVVTWENTSGEKDSYEVESYEKARRCVDTHIYHFDLTEYPCSVAKIECEYPDGKREYLYEAVRLDNEKEDSVKVGQNYDKLFAVMLDVHNIELLKHSDEKYEIAERNVNPEPYAVKKHYENAAEIINALKDTHFKKSYYDEIVSEIADTEPKPAFNKEWLDYMDKHEDFKYANIGSYDAVKLIVEADRLGRYIELDELISAEIKDSSLYRVDCFLNENYSGLMENDSFNDWSQVEEYAHEKLCKGLNVEIINTIEGGAIKINSDDYCADLEISNGEFPFKPDSFESGKFIHYERIEEYDEPSL